MVKVLTTLSLYLMIQTAVSNGYRYTELSMLESKIRQEVEKECDNTCTESQKTLRIMERLQGGCEYEAKEWKGDYIGYIILAVIFDLIVSGNVMYGDPRLLSTGLVKAILWILGTDGVIGLPILAWWARGKYKMFKKKAEELERDIRMFRMVKALKE